MAEQFANNATTTLNGTITSGATSLIVSSASLFPSSPQFRIIIDSEIMLVTGVSGTTFTVVRGSENTTPNSHTNGATVSMILTAGALDQLRSDLMNIESVGHRLTLSTGIPIPVSDVIGAGTIYLTPYTSTRIPLYNGTIWKQYSTPEISLALSIVSGNNYDVFAFDNSGVVALELSAAWTNNTTRADVLVQQDGVWVKSSNKSRRYLGTIRASGTNTTEDSGVNRLLYNLYNQIPIVGFASYTSDSGAFSGQPTFSDLVSVTVYGQVSEVHAHMSGVSTGGSTTAWTRILVDGSVVNHLSTYFELNQAGGGDGNSILGIATGLNPGFHTYKLQASKSGTNTWSISASSSPAMEGAWIMVKPYALIAP